MENELIKKMMTSPVFLWLYLMLLFSFVFLSCYLANMTYIALVVKYFLILLSLPYVLFVCLKQKKSIFLSYLIFFVFLLAFYGFVYLINGDEIIYQYTGVAYTKAKYLRDVLMAFLPIFPFYVFAESKVINERKMQLLSFFLLFLGVMIFYRFRDIVLLNLYLQGSMKTDITNETSYILLSLLPCVFLFKKKMIQLFFLIVVFVFSVLSYKRGATFISFMCIIVYFGFYFVKGSFLKKIGIFFLAVGLAFGGTSFFEKKYDINDYFAKRVDSTLKGNSSGRDEIYGTLLNYIETDMSPIEFFIGTGANGVLKESYTYAHNDFLAIFVEQGIIGFVFFIFFWITFFVTIIKLDDSSKKMALLFCFIICFGKSLFSMFYNPVTPNMMCSSIFVDAYIGYYLSDLKSKS